VIKVETATVRTDALGDHLTSLRAQGATVLGVHAHRGAWLVIHESEVAAPAPAEPEPAPEPHPEPPEATPTLVMFTDDEEGEDPSHD